MDEPNTPYTGPAGIFFTEYELRQLYAILNGGISNAHNSLVDRIDGYLRYLRATRELERDYRE